MAPLVEAGKSADGSGETVFTPSADGQTLRVRRLMETRAHLGAGGRDPELPARQD
jgi:hypothetical protein